MIVIVACVVVVEISVRRTIRRLRVKKWNKSNNKRSSSGNHLSQRIFFFFVPEVT